MCSQFAWLPFCFLPFLRLRSLPAFQPSSPQPSTFLLLPASQRSQRAVVLPVSSPTSRVVTFRSGARAVYGVRQRPPCPDRGLHQRGHTAHRRPDHRRQRSVRPKISEVILASLRSRDRATRGRAVRRALQRRCAARHSRSPVPAGRGSVALNTALRSMRPDGRTALYDAVVAGIDHLGRGSRARKVLVVVSDGGDNASEATSTVC